MVLSFHGFVKHGGLHRYLFGSNTERAKGNNAHPTDEAYRRKFEKKHGILGKCTRKRMFGRNLKRNELEREICNIKMKIHDIESKYSIQNNR